MTIRHRIVVRLSKLAVVGTLLFGTGSALYLLKLNQLSSILEVNKNIGALRGASQIDQIAIMNSLKEAVRACDLSNRTTCTEFLNLLVLAKNGALNYKIVLLSTLGVQDDSPIIRQIADYVEQVDLIPKRLFGRSLAEVSTNDGRMYDSYFDTVRNVPTGSNYLTMQYLDIKNKLSTLHDNLNISLNENFAFTRTSTVAAEQEVFIWLYFIIIAELAIFLFVSTSDLLINNSNPDDGFEFTCSKIQPKVIPLAASVTFGIISMALSQVLLLRQTTDTLIGNCREHNRTSIALLARVENLTISSQQLLEIDNVVEQPLYCSNYNSDIPRLLLNREYLSSLESEEVKEKLKQNYLNNADGFNSLQKQRSRDTTIVTMGVLIFNVLSLLTLAIFLRASSKEIG